MIELFDNEMHPLQKSTIMNMLEIMKTWKVSAKKEKVLANRRPNKEPNGNFRLKNI